MAGFFERFSYSKKRNTNHKHESSQTPDIVIKKVEPDISFPDYSGDFEKVNNAIDSSKKETLEAIHQENVKVYRNVQAVVVDETAKVSNTVSSMKSSLEKKINTAVIFSILAFSVALLNLVFDVLKSFSVF